MASGRNTSDTAEVDLASRYDYKTTRIQFSAHLPLARISAACGFAGRHPGSIDRTRSGKASSSLEPIPRLIDNAILTPPNDQLKSSSGNNSHRASGSTELICDVWLVYIFSHARIDCCSPTENEVDSESHTKPPIAAAKHTQNNSTAVYGLPILSGSFTAVGSFLYGYDLNIVAEGKPFHHPSP